MTKDLIDEVTPDGYRIVKPLPEHSMRGIQCGVCGARFDYGKPYGMMCGKGRCPIMTASQNAIVREV